MRTRTTLPLDDKGSLLELFSTVAAFDIWSYNVQLTGERLRDDGGGLPLAEISWVDAFATLEAIVLNILC